MNRLLIEITLVIFLLSSFGGLYYFIDKNGQLKKENNDLIETLEDNKKAVIALGNVITDLSNKYSKATNNEFKKFNRSDINKVSMGNLVRSYNIGIRRVLKNYKERTITFTSGNTQTTTP